MADGGRVADFHFDLPEELIAQHPPPVRGASRMLVVRREVREQGLGIREQGLGNREQQVGGGELVDAKFVELPEFLRAGDLLVLNDSRVLPARLFATRGGRTKQANSPAPSGRIEVLLTEEVEHPTVWNALVKPGRKVQVGETLQFFGVPRERDARVLRSAENNNEKGGEPVLTAEVVAAGERGQRTLRFAPVEDFYGVLGRIGHMPLPPYIAREQFAEADSAEDRERYQTVYSHELGSAAAPTAGLHFTPEVLAELAARRVEVRYVTLHVGLGTFQPVRVERLEEIRLHAERYTIPAETAEALNRARANGRRIVAVGTTTTRTLEHVGQQAAGRPIEAHSGSTSIFLSPGHRFRVVSGLLTNFHLPESTLLMLVSAFAGRETVLAAYAHAIRERYRFYSYGDCMLLL